MHDGPPFSRERELWLLRCDELLAAWVRGHPGTRPPVWWATSAPEARRQLGGRGTLLTQKIRNLRVPLDRGVPTYFAVAAVDPPVFESEASYLARLGLLLDGERERLTEKDFEPVEIFLDDEPEVA